MDPFTWILIALGVVVVGVTVWQMVRKSSRGVDDDVANRNRAQGLGNAELYGGQHHGGNHHSGHDPGPHGGGF